MSSSSGARRPQAPARPSLPSSRKRFLTRRTRTMRPVVKRLIGLISARVLMIVKPMVREIARIAKTSARIAKKCCSICRKAPLCAQICRKQDMFPFRFNFATLFSLFIFVHTISSSLTIDSNIFYQRQCIPHIMCTVGNSGCIHRWKK